MHWSSTSFATEDAPHLKEYLSLLGNPSPFTAIDPIGPDDALLVVDMQNDLLLRDAVTNPEGGRFGAPEGEQCVAPIVRMIEHFVERGGHVIATRTYHPFDHASFYTEGGPYPPHCVQGTAGAQLVPEIAEALVTAVKVAGSERVSVCFKGMHEQVGSFGALPYVAAGGHLAHKEEDGPASRPYHVAPRAAAGGGLMEALPGGCAVGGSAAPWSGALFLKQSAIAGPLAAKADLGAVDMNAPPDLCALVGDGVRRPVANLQDALQPRKRLFVCGLCLDTGVLDTCVNAAACGFRGCAYLVLDASRPAHVHGLGAHGSGFLYDPVLVRQKIEGAAVRLPSVAVVLAEPKTPQLGRAGKARPKAFPEALPAIGLEGASCAVRASGDSYSLARRVDGTLQDPTLRAMGHLFADTGAASPRRPLPPGWPGAPPAAVCLCWAYPLPKLAATDPGGVGCLMGASTSPELNFVAYGGFLLLSRGGAVVAVQALCAPKAGGATLRFDAPRRWRPHFLAAVEPRLQAITLPTLLRAGATAFCWLHPREVVAAGTVEWAPASTGAFLYQLSDGSALYFPLSRLGGGGRLSLADALPRLALTLGRSLAGVRGTPWRGRVASSRVAAAAAAAALFVCVAARRAR